MEEIKNALDRGQVATVSKEELLAALKKHNKAELKTIIETVPDIDIAEACVELENEDLVRLFRSLNSSDAASLYDALDSDDKSRLVNAMADKELIELINNQSADDVADDVAEMPANVAVKVLKAASPSMREDVNRLLGYKPDTAGAVMTTEYLEFHEEDSVKSAMETIRKRGKQAETVYTLFVKDKKRKFVGTVDLDELIFSEPEEKLSGIMNKDAPWVSVNTDREEMANAFRRYDLNAMAVLNADGCLTGIVTIDDAVDVMTEESTEDVEHMAGVSSLDDAYLETHPLSMAKKCVPWIIVLLILGTFSSIVLSSFQDALAVVPVLAAFIPVIMDTGGNSGGQTIALIVRGLGLGEFTPKETGMLIKKEALSSLLIGICVSVFAFVWFMLEMYLGLVDNGANIWEGNCWTMEYFSSCSLIAGVVALTLLVAILVSKLVAVLLPMGAVLIKKDPAIVSQPMLTTIVDVTSLIVFFIIAEASIIPLLA